MYRIAYKHFRESAVISAWRDSDSIYVLIDPLSPSMFVSENMFHLHQGNKSISSGAVTNTLPKAGNISTPETFTITIPRGFTDEQITLEIIGDEKYKLPVQNTPPPRMNSEQFELVPVRRFWNVKKGYHAYVTDPSEITELQQKHWQEWYDMGVCFWAFVEKAGKRE